MNIKLVLEITTEAQKEDIIQLAERLHVAVEVLEMTEEEEDVAMVRAIYAGAQSDILSPDENAKFLADLAKK